MSRKLNIVCYGDSNTYGYTPDGNRYVNRYPLIINSILGDNYTVNEEGVVGRTTIYSDKRVGRCAINNLDEVLGKYDYIDYLIIMLGTNDFKVKNARTTRDYAKGMNTLLDSIIKTTKIGKIILVSPILLAENIEELDSEFDHKSYLLSKRGATTFKRIASKYNASFFDAKTVAYPGSDGEHFTQEGHYRLANALAKLINKEKFCYEV